MKPLAFHRTLILACVFVAGNCLPTIAGECCSTTDDESVMLRRLQSAGRLIARARQLNDKTSKLSDQARKIAANATTVDVYGQYEDLFRQYESALKAYTQHRRDYFAHVQQFHQSQQPEMISGQSSTFGAAAQSNFGIKPLKFRVNDACSQLQQLEATLISNEEKLEAMMNSLYVARQRESPASYAGLWSEANQIAVADSALASQFNHLGIQKTAGISRDVRNLIDQANRDGAYSSHMQAYSNLSRGNGMENEIYQRSNMHGKFALQMLSRLNMIKPTNLSPAPAPATSNQIYSAEDLSNESQALDSEYAQVQNLLSKLEAVRKMMPPTFRKTGE